MKAIDEMPGQHKPELPENLRTNRLACGISSVKFKKSFGWFSFCDVLEEGGTGFSLWGFVPAKNQISQAEQAAQKGLVLSF
jgi:hypothetical protein